MAKETEFIDFVIGKLGEDYPKALNLNLTVMLRTDAYRIEVAEGTKRGVFFFPAEESGENGFAIRQDGPGDAYLNLKSYRDIPEKLALLLEEFKAQNPEYNIEIDLGD